MGQPRWMRAIVLTFSSIVAVCSAVVLLAYGFERLSFEPTATDNYWVWVLSGLGPWAAAAPVVAVTAILLALASDRGVIAFGVCAVAAVVAVTGLLTNLDRVYPTRTETQKLNSFANSAGIEQYRTAVDTSNGFPVGVIEWTSNEDSQQLCARLGADLSSWADHGSVTHPVGGGPQASSPGVPCRWIATTASWAVSGQVSVANSSASVRVEVGPPGTQ